MTVIETTAESGHGIAGKTDLDIAGERDNFPYADSSNPEPFGNLMASTWTFFIPHSPNPYGYLTSSTVEKMPWTADFRLAPETEGDTTTSRACELAMAKLIAQAREKNLFPEPGKRSRELYPILGAPYLLRFDRKAHALFGIVTRGVYLTVYTRVAGEMRLWISQRALDRPVYSGLLDNSIAGGVGADETVLDALAWEAGEEAGLDEGLVRDGAKACGTLTWINIKDERSGSPGMLHPGIQYIYDLEVEDHVTFRPVDGEVEKFNLWDVPTTRKAMAERKPKPSCALVVLDFLIRHGIITPDEERDHAEIVSRMHRRLPFPTCPFQPGVAELNQTREEMTHPRIGAWLAYTPGSFL
ncbi:putative thiamine pyrophosphokinase [Dichotomopilus funicola]|uniref:Thiamine pyrophosphokinase n=1 Tax=Dichotomopilus funicola TaxID=1934379 RepID=A0AAN6UUQ0_9PEZI|nr:putative thiamine pyrophosphokinase [Dichotomopilus funicola]